MNGNLKDSFVTVSKKKPLFYLKKNSRIKIYMYIYGIKSLYLSKSMTFLILYPL